MFNEHKPEVVAILETKVSFSIMGIFFNQFQLTQPTTMDPYGKMGGIWLLWNPSLVNMKVFHASQQVIHAIVTRNNYEKWLVSAVYTSPESLQLWANLSMISDNYNFPWLIAGAFKDHRGRGEKRSYSEYGNNDIAAKFTDSINSYNLVDLGSSGPRLTWSNG